MQKLFKTLFKQINAIVFITMALLLLSSCEKRKLANKNLVLYNYKEGSVISKIPIQNNDFFSIGFIHSVNKSPVIDYFKFDDENNIYVYKTIYYNFGAGVETELENNETLRYGDDGSMIIENIDKKIDDLIYYLSDIYDHTLTINDQKKISLWELYGKKKMVLIKIE